MVKQRVRSKLAFWRGVAGSALDNANGDGITKSLPHNGSTARWERGMALAAAASSFNAENHGGQLKVHDDAIFVFAFAKFLDLPT